MPAPQSVKWAVLERYGQAAEIWIETGTFLGDTTAFLAKSARHVYSIEPGPELAQQARRRFEGNNRVTIVEGLSEDQLPLLLPRIEGPVSFWLDGHYSEGSTFKGPQDCPVQDELAVIEGHLSRLDTVTVLVDDVRCFDPNMPEYSSYPSRTWLVNWADRNRLYWTIEHDIFAAWS